MALASAANAIPQTSCTIDDVVYYGSDNQVLSWQVESHSNPKALADLDGHIEALCRCGDNHLLVGTETGSVYLVNGLNGVFENIDQLSRPITCVAANYSGNIAGEINGAAEGLYAFGSMDGNMHLYNPSTKEKVKISLRGYAMCAAFCEDLLVIGGTFNKLMVIHLKTYQELWLEGHEGWVRSLSFRKNDGSSYTLASGSQEKYIRLWNFARSDTSTVESGADEMMLLNVKTIESWNITFEALLMGHDDWVVDLAWNPAGDSTLLSASSDSSLIVWMAENSDLWTPDYRLGDVSTWGASTATGTSGGFWAALWLGKKNSDGEIDCSTVATVTKTGSLRVWQNAAENEWRALSAPTGHFREVTDVAWFHDNFLLSTSLDQTTRLWYVKPDSKNRPTLIEIGRPQIHGYDMITVSSVDERTFVSAGDEKVMRIFELPRQVAEQMASISHHNQLTSKNLENLPLIAGVPALGLSNKAEVGEDVLQSLPECPQENHLQRLTLWPEVDKLYGHGFEISCLAVSLKHSTIISCSKANTDQHARLKFFSTKNYHEITKPNNGSAHSLTVTRLAVSPDGSRVLSVSRDRKFMITNVETQEVEIEVPKAHTRIIWDAAWFGDNQTFVTGSRDKQVKKWTSTYGEAHEIASRKFETPVTAVATCSKFVAVGEESGHVSVWDTDLDTQISEFKLPHRINRLTFDVSGQTLAAASGHTIQVKSLTV